MNYYLSIVLALALAPFVGAQVSIAGDAKIKERTLGVLTVAGAAPGAQVRWAVPDALSTDRQGGRMVYTGAPGSYKVSVLVIDFDKKLFTEADRTVTIDPAPVVPLPKDPPTPVPPAKMSKEQAERAIARIAVGSAGCTCCVIGPRRADGRWDVFCAAHCMGMAGKKGTVTFQDGRKVAVTRAWIDRASDGCWLITDDAGITDLPCVFLAAASPAPGTAVWQAGYGVGTKRATKTGTVSSGPDSVGMLFFGRLYFSSGDSGGPVFRSDTNEVVATVFGYRNGVACGCGSVLALANRPR